MHTYMYVKDLALKYARHIKMKYCPCCKFNKSYLSNQRQLPSILSRNNEEVEQRHLTAT